MLLMIVIAVFSFLVALACMVWRRLSVVEQEITFTTPQGGVTAITAVIRADMLQGLRIVYADGQVCEVFPRETHLERRSHSPGIDAPVAGV